MSIHTQEPSGAPLSDCPPKLLPYLASSGSLTAHLEALAGQPLRVKVMAEGWQKIDRSMQTKLGVHQAMAWVRTVQLFGDDEQAWVQATSIFPMMSLTGHLTRLKALKRTPIGYVLFKRCRKLPHKRSFYRVDGQFGRQTIYSVRDKQILVDERFLAGFVDRLQSQPPPT